jgi:hypothetical protein
VSVDLGGEMAAALRAHVLTTLSDPYLATPANQPRDAVDVRACLLRDSFSAHRAPIHSLLLCNQGATVVSCATDGSLRAWDRHSLQLQVCMHCKTWHLSSFFTDIFFVLFWLAFDSLSSGFVYSLCCVSPVFQFAIPGRQRGVRALALIAAHHQLVMGGTSGRLLIYDTRTWRLLLTVPTPGPVTALAAFGRDHLVSGHQRTVRSHANNSTSSASASAGGGGGAASVSSVGIINHASGSIGLGNYASSAGVADTDVLFVWDARRWQQSPTPLRSEQSSAAPGFMGASHSNFFGTGCFGGGTHAAHARRPSSSASSFSSASSALAPQSAQHHPSRPATGAATMVNHPMLVGAGVGSSAGGAAVSKARRQTPKAQSARQSQQVPVNLAWRDGNVNHSSSQAVGQGLSQGLSQGVQDVMADSGAGMDLLDTDQINTITTAAALAASSSLLTSFASAAEAAAGAATAATAMSGAPANHEHARAWTQAQHWAQQQVPLSELSSSLSQFLVFRLPF